MGCIHKEPVGRDRNMLISVQVRLSSGVLGVRLRGCRVPYQGV